MLLPIKPCHPNFKLPVYSTSGAGAFDIFSPVDITLLRKETALVPLGFHAEVPPEYIALLVTRSGLGCKSGLGLRNQLGVIDSDYRGEWMAKLTLDDFVDHIPSNNSPCHTIKAGDKILQCLILPVHKPMFEIVTTLSPTVRGAGGFGSTGS